MLNGTAPPEGSPWADKDISGASWTLLCPTDEAFKKYDLDNLYANPVNLQSIIAQHLIPMPKNKPTVLDSELNNNQPLPLIDSATYSTLYSGSSFYGDIIIRQREDSKELVVGIKGARGTDGASDWARVLSWGRSTTGDGTGGVVQIDQLLMPYHPSWWIAYGAPSTFGVFGTAAICAFFYGVRKIWQRDTTEATFEPVGGFGRDDDS
jgi:solute carrier family 25 carnitine/acylcarnitine transporter 20/29